MELISEELEKLQTVIFNYALVFPRSFPFLTFLGDLNKLLKQDMRSVDAGDSLQMWTTFLMVFELVFHVRLIEMDRIIKNPEKSLPPKQRKMSEMVRGGGASAYLKKVDKILDALGEQLVSQEKLAAIVCEGNLQKKILS